MSRVRVKFCGITDPGDAEAAVALGAWAVGLNLWPGSKRHVGGELAVELAARCKRRSEVVGVFVNQPLEEVVGAADAIGLTILQFHGDEGPVFCREAARRTGCRVIKAARVHSGEELQALSAFHTDYHLLDSYVPGIPGGTGEAFAWELAASMSARRGGVPMILAGGLNPGNVAEAIDAVKPYAVDVASGVERPLDPRRKDLQLMADFAWAAAQ